MLMLQSLKLEINFHKPYKYIYIYIFWRSTDLSQLVIFQWNPWHVFVDPNVCGDDDELLVNGLLEAIYAIVMPLRILDLLLNNFQNLNSYTF